MKVGVAISGACRGGCTKRADEGTSKIQVDPMSVRVVESQRSWEVGGGEAEGGN